MAALGPVLLAATSHCALLVPGKEQRLTAREGSQVRFAFMGGEKFGCQWTQTYASMQQACTQSMAVA